jgi:prepilin-type N-terminal cleavage/methylation domain-containing protein
MSNQRGYSLAELLVASAVLGFIMVGLFTLQRQGQAAYLTGVARAEVQQNARHVLELFTNELRSAQAITAVGAGCNTGPVPTNGGATTISFTDQFGTARTYTLVGTEFQRDGIGVVGGVELLRIWCLDAGSSLTAVVGDIRSVHVRVSTGTESGVASYNERTQHALFETRVRLRNL